MTTSAGALFCCLVLAAAAPDTAATQPASVLDALTVPPGTLATGCALIEAPSEQTAGGSVRSGLWAGLSIRSNPWAGADPRVVFEIRTRMFGLDKIPDAPPDLRSSAQLERSLVQGMSGYAAFYRHGEERVAVYALTPNVRDGSTRSWPAANDIKADRAIARLSVGQAAVLAVGEPGSCFGSIERHLRTVAAMPDRATSDSPPR